MAGARRPRDPPAGGEARGAGDRKYDIRGTPGRAGGGRGGKEEKRRGGWGATNHSTTTTPEGLRELRRYLAQGVTSLPQFT
ncbi:hypothetical protein Pmani_022186 [Petrolisthes manimaculis]|nr:hypothetical protein Pmani_022186 [Petrolisthes manimaculis]